MGRKESNQANKQMGILANNEDPQMKCSTMLHYIRICTVLLRLNNFQEQKYVII